MQINVCLVQNFWFSGQR